MTLRGIRTSMACLDAAAWSLCRLVALAVLLAGTVAQAQGDSERRDVDTPGLRIEAAAGWDGAVDRRAPVPVAFLIHNDSDRQVSGQLRLADPINGFEVLIGDVVISPGTARRFTSIRSMPDWDECFATFADETGVLWRRELPLNTGSGFDANVNCALFVDDGGRRLQLPGEVSVTAAGSSSDFLLVGEEGRPLKCLSTKTWQLPNHPGPMVSVQALIFPEGHAEDVSEINDVQWRAIAEWMCQGGVIFVHKESAGIVQRIGAATPLDLGPTELDGEFEVRRAGLGAIYEYDAPLLPSAGEEMRARISRTIALLPQQHVTNLLERANWQYWRGSRADRNRAIVAVFFFAYMLFVGVVPLLLFRLSKQRMAAYAVVVVVGASVLSGIMGGYLRSSRGDLNWITITEPGAGGLVTVGGLQVQSAGSRNTKVAVEGPNSDLQFVEEGRHAYRYYSWERRQTGHPPFTWQPDLAPGLEDTYQVNVTMTPWGRRQLRATAFERSAAALDIGLEFRPRATATTEAAQPGIVNLLQGEFTLRMTNNLPFDVRQGWLLVSTSQPMDASTGTPPGIVTAIRAGSSFVAPPVQQLQNAELFQKMALPGVAAGKSHEMTFDATFQPQQYQWNRLIQLASGYFNPPQVERIGSARAWIVAEINKSPLLSVDERLSDFDLQEELHLFVQEIDPAHMPDLGLPAAAPDSTIDEDPERSPPE